MNFFKKTSMLLNIYKSLKATVKSFLSLFPFIHFNTTYLEKKYPLQSFTKKIDGSLYENSKIQ